MARSAKDNQEIRDARREEILAAAARVFADKGLANTKISDIASAAGFSHGLVYHYFTSKDAVFGAIVDQMMEKVDEDLAADATLPAYERLVQGIERSRQRVCAGGADPGRVVAQAMMQGVLPPDIRERLLAHMAALHERVTERIAEAQQDGDLDPEADPSELSAALICLVRGMSIRAPGMPDLPFTLPRTETILRLLRRESAREKQTPREPRRAARGTHARRK